MATYLLEALHCEVEESWSNCARLPKLKYLLEHVVSLELSDHADNQLVVVMMLIFVANR